jgi:exodeoxyribonuclease V alpha subunit
LPLVPSRLLDRAMLYTALTRARISVVLVGDPALLAASILPEPRAWHRLQALDPDAAIRAQRNGGPGKMETVP